MCGGGGGCGGSPTTVQTNSQPPAWVQPFLQSSMAQASGIEGAQFSNPPQEGIVGLTPEQQNAYGMIIGAPGTAAPYLSSASTELGNASNLIGGGVGLVNSAIPYLGAGALYNSYGAPMIGTGFNTIGSASPYFMQGSNYLQQGTGSYIPDINQYMASNSPYVQNVVNATEKQFQNQNAIQANQLLGSAIQAGNAFGGDRAGVAEAQLAGQQQAQEAPVIAGEAEQGYQMAQQAAEAQKAASLQAGVASGQLGAGVINQGTAETAGGLGMGTLGSEMGNIGVALGGLGAQDFAGAGTLAGIGTQTAGVGLGAGNQQIAAGTAGYGAASNMQQTQQQADALALQNALMPNQLESWLAGIENPIAGAAGGTSNSSTTPGFNTASTLLGLGTAGLGIGALANTGAFSGLGSVFSGIGSGLAGLGLYRGGRVPAFQGGGVPLGDMGLGAPSISSMLSGQGLFPAPIQGGGMGIPKPGNSTPEPGPKPEDWAKLFANAKPVLQGVQDRRQDAEQDANFPDSDFSTGDANVSIASERDGGVIGYDDGGGVGGSVGGMVDPSVVNYYAMEAPLQREIAADQSLANALTPLRDGGVAGYEDGGTPNADTEEAPPAPEAPKLIDRSRFRDELDQNPQLREKMMRIMANEQGSHPEGTQGIAESAMNRAAVRGTSLEQQLRWHNAEPGGYYQMGSMGRGALENPNHHKILSDALDRALYGSNVSNYATDNASGAFAAGEARRGEFRPTNKINGETFFSPASAEPGLAAKYGDWRENDVPSGVATSALAFNGEPQEAEGLGAINHALSYDKAHQDTQPEGFMSKLGHFFEGNKNLTEEQKDRQMNAALALMAAGAGMMSGQSPHAFQNIGMGAQSGVKTFMTAEHLSREAEKTRAQIAKENIETQAAQENLNAIRQLRQESGFNAATPRTGIGNIAQTLNVGASTPLPPDPQAAVNSAVRAASAVALIKQTPSGPMGVDAKGQPVINPNQLLATAQHYINSGIPAYQAAGGRMMSLYETMISKGVTTNTAGDVINIPGAAEAEAKRAGMVEEAKAPYEILKSATSQGGRPIAVHPNEVVTTGAQVNPNLAAAQNWAIQHLPGAQSAGAPNATPNSGASNEFTPQLVRNPDGSLASTVTPTTEAIQKDAANRYEKAGDAYNNAQDIKQRLAIMRHDIDELNKAGWSSTGAGNAARMKIAKTINSVEGAFGMKPTFNPSAVASWEGLNKEATRMGFELARTLGSREAQMIVQQATAAVPNAENTPQGAKLVAASIEQTAQRQSDYYEFATKYAKEHNFDLYGAEIAFNHDHPWQEYSRRAIESVFPPQRPDGVPSGSVYSPKLKVWKTPDGKIIPNG